MSTHGLTEQSFSRRAMKAELLDAETELKLAYAWRDDRDERAGFLLASTGVPCA